MNGIILVSVAPAEDGGSVIDNEVLRAQEIVELDTPVTNVVIPPGLTPTPVATRPAIVTPVG